MGNKTSTEASASVDLGSSVPVDSETVESGPKMLIDVEIGGGKGFPVDATVVYFHTGASVMCVGTSGGGLYAFGDGFQYYHPWLTCDENEITSINAIFQDNIVVGYNDNSLAVFSLPNLNLIEKFDGNWLKSSMGDTVCIHIDDIGEKGYVYVGTTEGIVLVLEVNAMSFEIRECDYAITWKEAGLSKKMAISCIGLCPKDERYIAIGYDGDELKDGAVVLFDFQKKKPYRVYETAAVTTLSWCHNGEFLYCGTRHGEIMCLYLDKTLSFLVWCTKDFCKNRDDSDSLPIVRKLTWFACQDPKLPCIGCLFVLLGSFGEVLGSGVPVLIGLAAVESQEKLDEVLSVPVFENEEIVGFRIVPTVSCGEEQRKSNSSPVPALCIVTQKLNRNNPDASMTQLKLFRCPVSPNFNDWILEIGSLPEPRVATELLPAGSHGVTCLSALSPSSSPYSLSSILLNTQEDGMQSSVNSTLSSNSRIIDMIRSAVAPPMDGLPRTPSASKLGVESANSTPQAELSPVVARPARRGSTRDFFQNIPTETDLPSWEMSLTTAEALSADDLRLVDTVLTGHVNGSIVVFAALCPHNDSKSGRRADWIPRKVLTCGTSPITLLETDSDRLLIAGNENGHVRVWETVESDTGRSGWSAPSCPPTRQNSESSETSGEMQETVSSHDISLIIDSFKPDELRLSFDSSVKGKVTSARVVGEVMFLFVGTADGNLYVSRDWSTGEFIHITSPLLGKTGASGAVVSIVYSSFYHSGSSVPVIYAIYASGHVVVWNIFTNELLGYCAMVGVLTQPNFPGIAVNYAQVVDSSLKPAARPNPYATPVTTSSAPPRSEDSSVDHTPAPVPAVSSPVPNARSSIFSRMSSNGRSSSAVSSPVPLSIPPSAARYLFVVDRNNWYIFDLFRFSLPIKGGFSSAVQGACISTLLSREPIIGAQETEFVEEAARAYATPVNCLSYITFDGYLSVLSLKSKQDMIDPSSEKYVEDCGVSVLCGVETAPTSLSQGVLLQNGDFYLLRNSMILFCGSVIVKNYIHEHKLPTRTENRFVIPPAELRLRHGREDIVANNKKQLSKRRSILSLSSAPTDLSKIFMKTRTEREKDELCYALTALNMKDTKNDVGSALRGVDKVKAEMTELGKSLEERGERLSRINQQTDQFHDAAAEFNRAAREQRDKLKEKNARWGFF